MFFRCLMKCYFCFLSPETVSLTSRFIMIKSVSSRPPSNRGKHMKANFFISPQSTRVIKHNNLTTSLWCKRISNKLSCNYRNTWHWTEWKDYKVHDNKTKSSLVALGLQIRDLLCHCNSVSRCRCPTALLIPVTLAIKAKVPSPLT